ncbi:hypothetical protein RB595_010732 [Gaeumannomyces hyphopodioides]
MARSRLWCSSSGPSKMPNMTAKVYLITGANRGIGRGLFNHYASQPNVTVVAGVRDPANAKSLKLLDQPKGENTRVVLVKLDSSSKADPFAAVKDLHAKGIDHVDVVISNAAVAHFALLGDIAIEEFEEMIRVNSTAVLLLYKAFLPLLQAAAAPAKFILVGSAAGSIGTLANTTMPIGGYGATKALSNYLVVKMGAENDWLVAVCINPGHVQTDMGDDAGVAVGLEKGKAPVSLEQCVENTTHIIENCTKQEHSGKFFDQKLDIIHQW